MTGNTVGKVMGYLMKQDLINAASNKATVESCREVTFVKRAGYVFGAGALAALTVGAIGIYALIGGSTVPVNASAETYSTAAATAVVIPEANDSNASESAAVDPTAMTAMMLKKANVSEYGAVFETVKAAGMADISASKTAAKSKPKKVGISDKPATIVDDDEDTQAVKAAETTDSKDAAEENDEIKTCGVMTMYTTDGVNLREGASLNDNVLKVIPASTEVLVTGYNNDWYRIKADNQTGYCLKRYLSSDMPVQEESSVNSTGSVIAYNETEFDMLCYVLQSEVGDCSEASKMAVANVIINRVKSPLFPDSIYDVLTQADQFTAVYNYYYGYSVPSQNTIDCARAALSGSDNTGGAVYYYSPMYCDGYTASWFETLTFCAEIEGQRYFR